MAHTSRALTGFVRTEARRLCHDDESQYWAKQLSMAATAHAFVLARPWVGVYMSLAISLSYL